MRTGQRNTKDVNATIPSCKVLSESVEKEQVGRRGNHVLEDFFYMAQGRSSARSIHATTIRMRVGRGLAGQENGRSGLDWCGSACAGWALGCPGGEGLVGGRLNESVRSSIRGQITEGNGTAAGE
jgi:hypothetical protein